MKGREFPLVGVIVFLVVAGLLTRWMLSPGEKAGDKCPPQTADNGVVMTKCEMEESSKSVFKMIEEYAAQQIAAWRYNERIKQKYLEKQLAQGEGQRKANEVIAKDLAQQGGNVDVRVASQTQIKVAQERAKVEREQNEQHRSIMDRDVEEDSDRRAFKQTKFEDSGARVRFEEALKELRKKLATAGGVLEVSDDDRKSFDAAKAVVVDELNKLLAELPRWKGLMSWLNRVEKGYGREEQVAQVKKDWAVYVGNCHDMPPWCWAKFVKDDDGGLNLDRMVEQIKIAFTEFRFHDAADMVDQMVKFAVERPAPPRKPPGTTALSRLSTFCAEIKQRGYLAVDQGRLRLDRELGPVTRYVKNDMYAPQERHCVWAWRVGGFEGWSLQCSNWPFGYDFPTGDLVKDTQAAPDGLPVRGYKINPTAQLEVERTVARDCAAAIDELKATKKAIEPDRTNVPGLQGIVNRVR